MTHPPKNGHLDECEARRQISARSDEMHRHASWNSRALRSCRSLRSQVPVFLNEPILEHITKSDGFVTLRVPPRPLRALRLPLVGLLGFWSDGFFPHDPIRSDFSGASIVQKCRNQNHGSHFRMLIFRSCCHISLDAIVPVSLFHSP
jgi:hypothetical protein